MPENPDATLIPDKAEVWIALATGGTTISSDLIPEDPDGDLAALGWDLVGLIDAAKGIPVTPSGELKEYDAFGRPRFRVKFKKGKLSTGFTALELENPVVQQITLPGSAPDKIGVPKDVQIFVLYRYVDEATTQGQIVWCSLTKAPVQLKSHSGFIDGELASAEIEIAHTTDAAGDVFQVISAATLATADDVEKTLTIAAGVTEYTVTAGTDTTAAITTKTASALQSALRLLASVQALPTPGVTVTGTSGGPLVATFTGPITPVTATGTGGTVTVA